MREEIKKLVAMGPLQSEDDTRSIERLEEALHSIKSPVTDEEAEALLTVFGPDDCFGLSWTLLHLVETSPTPFPQEQPGPEANPWLQLLYARAH
ncbi:MULTISPECIES: hypothetical protein [Salipiger]|uniref:hypothetical protein n=1 Tax=Salipiger TaxID=263377 RepID=UPI001A9606D0|nr:MULTISPECIES: hypothetical protein [Salipiger]